MTETDEGAALIDLEGRVLTLGPGETEPTLVWEPNPGANPTEPMPVAVTSFVGDRRTVFFSVAHEPPPSPLPDPQFPMPPSSIQRVRIDGLDHAVLLESGSRVFGSLQLAGEHVYYTDAPGVAFSRMDKNGADDEVVLRAREAVPGGPGTLGGVAVLGDALYFVEAGELLRQRAGEDAEVLLAAGDQPMLANGEPMLSQISDLRAGTSALVLVAADPRVADGQPDQTIAIFDPSEECLRVLDTPDGGITWPVWPHGEVLYWKGFGHGGVSPGDPDPGARLWRTDLRSGESVELEPDDLAVTLTTDVLGQDADHLYVTTGDDLIQVAKQ